MIGCKREPLANDNGLACDEGFLLGHPLFPVGDLKVICSQCPPLNNTTCFTMVANACESGAVVSAAGVILDPQYAAAWIAIESFSKEHQRCSWAKVDYSILS